MALEYTTLIDVNTITSSCGKVLIPAETPFTIVSSTTAKDFRGYIKTLFNITYELENVPYTAQLDYDTLLFSCILTQEN
jgi:hypothetical protein